MKIDLKLEVIAHDETGIEFNNILEQLNLVEKHND